MKSMSRQATLENGAMVGLTIELHRQQKGINFEVRLLSAPMKDGTRGRTEFTISALGLAALGNMASELIQSLEAEEA